MERLDDRVCVVMGGGSIAPGWGIGKAISVAYAQAGACVAVVDRNLEAACETVDVISSEGGCATAFGVDATNEGEVGELMDQVVARFGSIDVLHNNVGIGKSGASEETSVADWRRIIDANLVALHIASQAALVHMKKAGRVVILTTSTIASLRFLGFPHLAYGSTKAAANQFTKLVAVEYARYGIRANSIIVGLLDTPRIHVNLTNAYGDCSEEEMMEKRNRQVPLGFMGNAWDVAHASVFLASDDARYVTGTELVIDGGVTASITP